MKKLTEESDMYGKTVSWTSTSFGGMMIIFSDKSFAWYDLNKENYDNIAYLQFNTKSINELSWDDVCNMCVIATAPKELWDEKQFEKIFNKKRDEYFQQKTLKDRKQLQDLIDKNIEFVKEYIKEKDANDDKNN